MASKKAQTEVYLEVGQKKIFAGALDWPGWCRSARDEETALAALVEYAPRYARIFSRTTIDFVPPDDPAAFAVVERLAGNSTTDFGAPDVAPARDAGAVRRGRARALRGDPGGDLASVRSGGAGGGGEGASQRPARRWPRARRDRAARPRSRRGVSAPRRAEVQPGRRGAAGRRTAADARGDPRGAGGRGARGDPDPGAARRRALDAALLRAARRLAHRRSPLGDRGSDRVSGEGLRDALGSRGRLGQEVEVAVLHVP